MYFSVSLTICCRGLKMLSTVFWAILIPFLGTVAGSAFCFFIKKKSLGSLENIYTSLLSASANAFLEASNAHFKLEDIYISSMNFKNNDKIIAKLKEKIFYELDIV